jgi:hypothetical protein
MSQRPITKDERFLVTLCELASASGEPTHEIDRYAVGREVGQHDKAVDHTVRMLMQSNFIKKGSQHNFIYLTQGGLDLIRQLTKQ